MYANRAFQKAQQDASPNTISDSYVNSGVITSQALLNLQLPEGMTSIWIMGPTGVGKTTWALTHALKPSLFVRHLDTLREFRNGYHKSLIFDDMSFRHIPRVGQLEIVDRYHPTQVHIRYQVVTLPAGIPKIFLSNDEIFDWDEAIHRRITKIDLFAINLLS